MEKITYEELEHPNFVNSHPAITLTAYKENGERETIILPFSDVLKTRVLAGCSSLSIGDTGCGKSVELMDIHRNYFGGEADSGGRSNWIVAKHGFTADGFFYTIDQSKVGEGKGMLIASRVPIENRVRAVHNAVDEMNLVIPEEQVEFFGIGEGRHKGLELGERGYHLFTAACNMNRVNGDFAGVSQINRALLNRCPVTLDFDFFSMTDEDRDILAKRKTTGRMKLAPIRDITDKIISAYQEIQETSSQRDPFLDAYIRFLSSGLDYCHIDKEKKKKKAWPSRCSDCDFMSDSKESKLCHLIKQCTQRTAETTKLFANGLNYLVALKHGQKALDPLDLALEAFQFTTYHGNLNQVETQSTYAVSPGANERCCYTLKRSNKPNKAIFRFSYCRGL